MKKSNFRIDTEKALRLGLIGCITIKLNGRKINKVVSASIGRQGHVVYCPEPLKVVNGKIKLTKKKGNVTMSLSRRW